MFLFTKSVYFEYKKCRKCAWLEKYKQSEGSEKEYVRYGNDAFVKALEMFGDYADVTAFTGSGDVDLEETARRTAEEIEKGTDNICGAAFVINGLCCTADLIRRAENGWLLYEFKSSKGAVRENETEGLAFGKYVLGRYGIKVQAVYIISINDEFVYREKEGTDGLFVITDVSGRVDGMLGRVKRELAGAEKALRSASEPNAAIAERCMEKGGCGFFDYCKKIRGIPEYSVFDIKGLCARDKTELYKNGFILPEDLAKSGRKYAEKIIIQAECGLNADRKFVCVKKIREFLGRLSYPLYFLDFERIQPYAPIYEGTRPYQFIPVQYSVHCLAKEGDNPEHAEYLAQPGPDPRRALAEKLCKDIPYDACTVVYDKMTESDTLKELAGLYPDLAEHLESIRNNLHDLQEPFRNFYCYTGKMNGSCSLKSVLPALYPDDPGLDYQNLDGVRNGQDAMTTYLRLKDMTTPEREKARTNMLKYCELDTLAMVKIFQKLIEMTK